MFSEEVYEPAGAVRQRHRLQAFDEDWAAGIRAARHSERDLHTVGRESHTEYGAAFLGCFALAGVPCFGGESRLGCGGFVPDAECLTPE